MRTDLVLVAPPQWGYGIPHISLPALAASTRRADFSVIIRDLNLELGERLLSPEFVRHSVERIEARRSRLDPVRDAGQVRVHEEYLAMAASLVPHIDRARRLLLSSLDPGEVGYAINITSGALRLVSQAFAPARLTMNHYNYGDSVATDLDLVLREAGRADANPYFDVMDDQLLDSLLASDPRAVGISVTSSSQLVPGLTLASRLRRVAPHVRTILGGVWTKYMLDVLPNAPDLFDWLDYVVLGEGESVLNDLLAAFRAGKEPAEQPGLWSRDARLKPRLAPAEVVADLPTPDYSDIDVERYPATSWIVPLLASRGCPWGHCTFCGLGSGYAYRERPIPSVIDDIASIVDTTGARHITFNDEAISPVRTRAIGEGLAHRGIDVRWDMMARLEEGFTGDLLAGARANGLGMVKWGFESGSPRTVKRMGKGIKVDTARRVLRRSAEADIWNHVWIMVGFPGESRVEFEETLSVVRQEDDVIDSVFADTFSCVKGAPIFDHPQQFGIRLVPASDRSIVREQEYEVVDGASLDEVTGFYGELGDMLARDSHLGVKEVFEGLTYPLHVHLVDRLGRRELRRQIVRRAADFQQVRTLSDEQLLGPQSLSDFEVYPLGARSNGAEAIVVLPDTGKWLMVNWFGMAVLSELRAGGTPADAAARVSASHGVPRAQVERDCADFVRALMTSGIVGSPTPLTVM